MIYAINYDLKKPGQNYEALQKVIQDLGTVGTISARFGWSTGAFPPTPSETVARRTSTGPTRSS